MDLSEIHRAITRGLAPLRVPAPLSLPEWAERHFYLSAESSYVETSWHAFPYQLAILHAMGNDAVRLVAVQKSARVGYTKMMVASLLFNAHHRRRNQGVWNPTDDDSDEFCKVEFEPALRDVEAMRAVCTPDRAKDRANTLRTKLFRGSSVHLRGGKAAKNYRRLSLDIAYIDELDGFDADIEREGDAVSLVSKRLEGATWPKLIAGSTPKLAGSSQITHLAEQCDVLYTYHVPCPHCDELHPLTWTAQQSGHGTTWAAHGLVWAGSNPETAAHRCPHCAALMTQAEYLRVWIRGTFVGDDGSRLAADGTRTLADGTRARLPERIAFQIWTAYSPMVDWSEIVREYLAAEAAAKTGDLSKRKAFANTTLGIAFEESGEHADAGELRARAEDYPLRRVPRGALVLTAGIDVQDNRLEAVVWGWGRGEESWAIDYTVLHGDPAQPEIWASLDAYLATRFPHEGGQYIGIDAAAIDTQGHHTHAVYRWVQRAHARKVFATKGHSLAGKPIVASSNLVDVNVNGQVQKHGVRLWMVGTDTVKDVLFARLRLATPGPGYAHLSKHLPAEFFEHFAAESRVPVKTARGRVTRWVCKSGARNEALDCSVLALFAACRLDLHRYTSAMWTRLEAILCPPIRDLFAPNESPVKSEAPPTPHAAEAAPDTPDGAGPPSAPPSGPAPDASGAPPAARVPAALLAQQALARAARPRPAARRATQPRIW